MANDTAFAHAYRMATAHLLEAIANPTQRGFSAAYKWAGIARANAYGDDVAVGDEWDTADTLRYSIRAAAKYAGYEVRRAVMAYSEPPF